MNLAQNQMSQAFSRNEVKIESGILHTDEIKRMKLVARQINLVCQTASTGGGCVAALQLSTHIGT